MQTRKVLSLLLLLLSCAVQAQQVSVTGLVRDTLTREPLEGATVRFLAADSTLVGGAITGREGRFVCRVPAGGRYLLNVSFMGYVLRWRVVSTPRKGVDTLSLAPFDMAVDAVRLKETEVAVQQLMIVTRGDTLIYNADAFKPGDTDMLRDLFKRIPGLEVDGGQVKINGKAVSRILINGDDFFGTDALKALDNLPAYMADEVKAYEKENEKNRITKFDDGLREQVLDVTLKRKYLDSWLANATGAYGTKNTYVGHLFANRFDECHRVSAYGAVNNINERGTAAGNGNWNVGTRSNGDMKYQSGGVDMLYRNGTDVNKPNYVRLTGNASVTNENMGDRSGMSKESLLPGFSSFVLSEGAYRDRGLGVSSRFQLDWRPSKSSFVSLYPALTYKHSQGHSASRGGTWNVNPYESSAAPLDSLLADPDRFGTDAVNSRMSRNRDESESVRAELGVWANWWVTSDGCNFTLRGDLDYRNSVFKSYSQENYTYYQTQPGEDTDFRNVYTRSPSSFWSARFYLHYTHVFKSGVRLRGTYGLYKSYHDDRGHYRYRLDSLDAPWNNPVTAVLGWRPDDLEALARALDLQNSYDSELHGTHQWFELGLNWVWQKKLTLFAQLGLQPYTDVVDYRRNGVEKHLSKSYFFINPVLKTKYATDSLGTVEFEYNTDFTGDYMLRNLIDVTDDTDPLNIRKGNPDLEGYYTHRFDLKYNLFNKRHQYFNVRLNHTLTSSSVGYVQRYDPATGVTVSRPENMEGNRDWSASVYVTLPLDAKNRWALSPNLSGNHYRSVAYTRLSGATESVRDVIRIRQLTPGLNLSYTREKFNVSCNTSVGLTDQHSRLGVGEQTVTTLTCTPSAWVMLPGSVRLSTSVRVKSAFGYDDPEMNRTLTVWRMSAERTFLRKKNLTLRVLANDLLGQFRNDGIRVYDNYRTSWWSQGTVNYVMFSLSYKLQSKKKD